MSKPIVKVKDESQDQRYFTITPRIVWAFSRNPYDYSLWNTVKTIAGESGECYLSTEELAILSMMSTGQASISRKYWMEIGFLFGDFRRDPGYPQKVWHLRVPNLWQANIQWAEEFASLKDRVEFKRQQTLEIELNRQIKKGNDSLHQVKPSPGDGGVTPGDGGVTPGETKKIKQEELKKSATTQKKGMINPNTGNRTDAIVKGDMMDGILFGAALANQANAELTDKINLYPPDCQATLKTMVDYFHWQASTIPGEKESKFGQWILEIRDINKQVGEFGQEGVKAACKASDDLTVSHPAGINWAIGGEVGKLAKKKNQVPQLSKPLNTPFTNSLNSQPLSEESKEKLRVLREKINKVEQ